VAKYNRLTIYEREEISLGLAKGCNLREIASLLTRSPSTVCHEINRNTKYGQEYRAVKAQRFADKLTHTPVKNVN